MIIKEIYISLLLCTHARVRANTHPKCRNYDQRYPLLSEFITHWRKMEISFSSTLFFSSLVVLKITFRNLPNLADRTVVVAAFLTLLTFQSKSKTKQKSVFLWMGTKTITPFGKFSFQTVRVSFSLSTHTHTVGIYGCVCVYVCDRVFPLTLSSFGYEKLTAHDCCFRCGCCCCLLCRLCLFFARQVVGHF